MNNRNRILEYFSISHYFCLASILNPILSKIINYLDKLLFGSREQRRNFSSFQSHLARKKHASTLKREFSQYGPEICHIRVSPKDPNPDTITLIHLFLFSWGEVCKQKILNEDSQLDDLVNKCRFVMTFRKFFCCYSR